MVQRTTWSPRRSTRQRKARTWLLPPATATSGASNFPRTNPWVACARFALIVPHSEPELALLGELRELAPPPVLGLADLGPTLLRLAHVMPLRAVITEHPGLLQFLGESLQESVEALVLAQLDMNRLRHLTSHPFGATGLVRRFRTGTLI